MSTVTILSKQPPEGRCSLYMRYAEALRQALGFQPEVRYCDGSAAVPPPAMLSTWGAQRPHRRCRDGTQGGLIDAVWPWRKNLGSTPAQETAALLARSLRTLVVRVRAQNAAALAVARAMEGHPPVARVLYPGLESESFDLIVSNCVINLSPDKPGGELYFSDVYADRRVPPELAADPVLYGECLAGALYWNVTVQTPPTPTLPHEGEGGKESAPYVLGTPGGWRESEWLHWNDFLHLARNAGFTDQRRVEDRPIGIADPLIEERVAPTRFYSATYRLFKLPGLEHDCEDYGQAVAYRGTLPRHPGAWSLDKHHRFPTDKVAPVCGNTQRMLYETRFRPHFDFFGDGGQHLGLFEDCGGGLPFTAGGDGQTATCC